MEIKPAIVVITFNRPHSLKRLLDSINSAFYTDKNIPLIISIDYQDSKAHEKVVQIAKEFYWAYGKKSIIEHTTNFGLKNHVITCGNLVYDYETIIMLEDDIFVSPEYYQITCQTLKFYSDEDKIGGVSLYSHKKNFLNGYPFETIPDSKDVYFLQIASSWGQAWTKKQWHDFKVWFSNNKDISESDPMPLQIKKWPKTSWLKHFIKYLVCTDKFFVYPKSSLTTNFGDSGTHNKKNNVVFQVPLSLGKDIILVKIEQSLNVYDAFFEILPSRLKMLSPILNDFDFSVDLFGMKELKMIETEYLLSSKNNNNIFGLKSFGLEMKPLFFNIVYNIEGNEFTLDLKDSYKETGFLNVSSEVVFDYMFSRVSIRKVSLLLLNKLKSKLKNTN